MENPFLFGGDTQCFVGDNVDAGYMYQVYIGNLVLLSLLTNIFITEALMLFSGISKVYGGVSLIEGSPKLVNVSLRNKSFSLIFICHHFKRQS